VYEWVGRFATKEERDAAVAQRKTALDDLRYAVVVPAVDDRLQRLHDVIRLVVEADLPDLPPEDREQLIGHLAGAVFVS
jgi:hypothetical protein